MYSKNSIFILVCVIFLIAVRFVNATPGELDYSFGENGTGIVTTLVYNPNKVFIYSSAYASVIQPDDKIITVGSVYTLKDTSPVTGQDYDIVIVRYNADGTLDDGFGNGGKILTRVNSTSQEEAYAVALQPDGKIVVAGAADVTTSYSGTRRYFILWRFNSNGTTDYSFGISGKTMTEGFVSDYQQSGAMIRALVIQPDGKIFAVGTARYGSGDFGHTLIRYNSNGTIDSTLGGANGGKKFFYASTYQSFAYGAGQQSNGEIIIGGYGLHKSYFRNIDFSAIRFNSLYSTSGTIDSSVLTHFYDTADDRAYAVAVQPDDKFILAGETVNGSPEYEDYAIARYNADGTRDESFGYLGRVSVDIAGDTDKAFGTTVQSDGKIIAVGYSWITNRGSACSLARFNDDGTLDLSFGTFGKITVLDRYGSMLYSVGTQSDGKIVAVGRIEGRFGIARFEN